MPSGSKLLRGWNIKTSSGAASSSCLMTLRPTHQKLQWLSCQQSRRKQPLNTRKKIIQHLQMLLQSHTSPALENIATIPFHRLSPHRLLNEAMFRRSTGQTDPSSGILQPTLVSGQPLYPLSHRHPKWNVNNNNMLNIKYVYMVWYETDLHYFKKCLKMGTYLDIPNSKGDNVLFFLYLFFNYWPKNNLVSNKMSL